MTNDLDQSGPIDYLVVEFPAGQANFTGEMAAELKALVEGGTIRILDLLIITKDADGTIDSFEVDDFEGLDELRRIETELADLLAADDVVDLAEAMEPGSVAGVLVWEDRWAAPFASAARRAGVNWSPTAGSRSRPSWRRCRPMRPRSMKEIDMLGRGRVGRPGVIGRPVARTAAVVGSAAVVAHGVRRRGDRREDRRDDRRDRR